MAMRFSDFLAGLRGRGKDPDRERLVALLDLNKALATERSPDGLAVRILDSAIELFGAERGFLLLDDAGSLRVSCARTLDREALRNAEKKFSRSVVARVLATGEPILSDDASADADLAASASIADLKLRSVLCVVLRVQERRLGCLYLDHRFQTSTFKDEDRTWLAAFADQAAIAFDHARLLAENVRIQAELVDRNRRLEALVEAKDLEISTLRQEPAAAGESLRLAQVFPELVGGSAAMARVRALIEKVAAGPFPVLVTGESGTGKELVARAIWHAGPRAAQPFIAVNCAALSQGILESELFGHVKGAFTGAVSDHVGLLREADGGVLFLDEFTEMGAALQAKLLRFLEDGEVRAVGGPAGSRVDVRVVAATNRDPAEEVRQGRLRADLYFRLHVVEIHVPPLRERREDIPDLVRHFLERAARERGAGAGRGVAPGALARLAARPWPGNVRELKNEVTRLDATCAGGTIEPAMVERAAPGSVGRKVGKGTLADLEERAIREALETTGGNKAEAARLLGIPRRTLYSKLKKK